MKINKKNVVNISFVTILAIIIVLTTLTGCRKSSQPSPSFWTGEKANITIQYNAPEEVGQYETANIDVSIVSDSDVKGGYIIFRLSGSGAIGGYWRGEDFRKFEEQRTEFQIDLDLAKNSTVPLRIEAYGVNVGESIGVSADVVPYNESFEFNLYQDGIKEISVVEAGY